LDLKKATVASFLTKSKFPLKKNCTYLDGLPVLKTKKVKEKMESRQGNVNAK
jgi:hypothetical protein